MFFMKYFFIVLLLLMLPVQSFLYSPMILPPILEGPPQEQIQFLKHLDPVVESQDSIGSASLAFRWAYDQARLGVGLAQGPFIKTGAWDLDWEKGLPQPIQSEIAIIPNYQKFGKLNVLEMRPRGLTLLRRGEWCGEQLLYVGGHGVAVYDTKKDLYTWAWVSGVLPDSVTKLRGPSIEKAECLGKKGLVLITLTENSHRVRIVSAPWLGRWGWVDPTFGTINPQEAWEALNGTLYDLDGDQLPESITWDFSEGAHCCYIPTLHLSRTQTSVTLPNGLDGNGGGFYYADLLDEQDIQDICDFYFPNPVSRCAVVDEEGHPALLLHYNYNGKEAPPLDEFQTGWLLFDFWKGPMKVREWKPNFGEK